MSGHLLTLGLGNSLLWSLYLPLARHVVSGAALENGLLHIDLVREVPEEKKPRVIPVVSAAASRPVLQAAE